MKYQRLLVLGLIIFSVFTNISCFESNNSYPPQLGINNQYTPPNQQQKLWALATCAVLTESNKRRHDLLGGCKRTPKNIKDWQDSLSEWWGVHNKKELLETLDWIKDGGHRKQFDMIAKDLSKATPAQISDLKKKVVEKPSIKGVETIPTSTGL